MGQGCPHCSRAITAKHRKEGRGWVRFPLDQEGERTQHHRLVCGLGIPKKVRVLRCFYPEAQVEMRMHSAQHGVGIQGVKLAIETGSCFGQKVKRSAGPTPFRQGQTIIRSAGLSVRGHAFMAFTCGRDQDLGRRADVDLRPGQSATIFGQMFRGLARQGHIDDPLCCAPADLLQKLHPERIKRDTAGRQRNIFSCGRGFLCRSTRLKPVIDRRCSLFVREFC